MNNANLTQKDSAAWSAFVKISFVFALGTTSMGVFLLPVDLWVKGYIAMGLYFVVTSTVSLSKTLRDEHEAKKIVNKISNARTEKLLKDYDLDS